MKRPPDRKLALAIAILAMAMSATLSRPAAGLTDNGENAMLMFKKVAGLGGR